MVDCDPGIDDALALYALLGADDIKVRLVSTVFGNVTVKQATRNVLRLLGCIPPILHPQVAEGSDQPLTGSRLPKRLVHGHDGLADLTALPVAPKKTKVLDALSAQKMLAAGTLAEEMIALGPLTNIARYFAAAPQALQKLKTIAVMAGVLGENQQTNTEFNLASDTSAGRCLLGGRLPLRWIPFSVTRTAAISREAAVKLRDDFSGNKLGEVIGQLLLWTIDKRGDGNRFAFADAVAAALVVEPSFGKWQAKRLVMDDKRTGRLGVEHGLPNASVCQAIDDKAIVEWLIKSWSALIRKTA